MKRPEGFDDRPAPPDDAAGAEPRVRRASVRSRLTARRGAVDGLEARPGSAPEAGGTQAPASAPATAGPHADATDAPWRAASDPDAVTGPRAGTADAPSARAAALAGAAGRRLGAGMASVAERLRQYTPDEDHRAPVDGTDDATAPADPGATDVLDTGSVTDLHRASRPDEAPLGAGVRAAETAREARVARRRRRLLERAEVRRFTRRSRHRRAAWITSGAVVVVLGVSILVAVFSPLMALRTIEIKGTSRVDETQLRQALSDQIGTPLARIDFGEIKKDIAGFPLIESYVTEEAPPHTLVITVTERSPVVAVKTGDTFDLVDPAGIVVQSTPSQPGDMPVADIGTAKLGSSVFRTMTEVVLALPSTVRSQVSGVAASTADDVTLTMKDGSKVVWGSPDDSDAKAALLDALVKDHAARDPGAAVEYDVSAPDNGIIRSQS